MMPKNKNSSQNMVTIGKLGGTYRVAGDLHLYIHSDSIEIALSYGDWWIKKPSKNEWALLKNEKVYRLGQKFFIHLANVDTKEYANAFVNAEIAVPRSSLPATLEDEFYWVDLVGMNVINRDNFDFGKVTSILETGANDVLIVNNTDKEHLIPFVENFIINVDYTTNNIIVDWEDDY